jgi:hypothetical protein
MESKQENITIYLFNLEELIEDIRNTIGYPVNFWAVAATIESFGIRDIDAQQDYGFENVFKLAEYIFKQLVMHYEKKEKTLIQKKEIFSELTVKEKLKTVLKHYLTGLLFAIPMLVQIASVIAFDYGLWAWVKFNKLQATMVALATIAGFVLTGGFVQVMGYQLTYYKGQENYKSAYEIAVRLFIRGMGIVLMVIILTIVGNLLLGLYPGWALFIAAIYFFFLSALLLSSGILYALELKFAIALSIVIGTLFVILGMEILGIGIYFSHWLGILVSVIINIISGYIYFQIKMKHMPGEYLIAKLPPEEITFYSSYRYFVYGSIFFMFLFVDRIFAWSTGTPPPPYVIWFNTPYELGMDWALIPLLTTMALLDYSVHRFSKELIPIQKMVIFEEYEKFNRYFRQFYYRQLFYLIFIGTSSILGAYYFVKMFEPLSVNYSNVAVFFANPVTEHVFWMGSIGYIILCIGLLNSLFFFTLYRPAFAMNGIVLGILTNIFIGYLCSRLFSYEYAVLGLISGAAIFAVLTSLWARKIFKNLDYFYFGAF